MAARRLRSGQRQDRDRAALPGAGGIVVSSIIVARARCCRRHRERERAKDATGGLLRQIGDRGVLVIKDVTSILSMDRDTRGEVLAALREVYDGHWARNVGTDGGRTLAWEGRIAVIGAVTTPGTRLTTSSPRWATGSSSCAWTPATGPASPAGAQAIGNTGDEIAMRDELAAAVAGVIAGMNTDADPADRRRRPTSSLAAADLVTRARTGVDYDYRGDVIDAHAPEMPTRFAKQLAQVVRGAVAIGIDRADALRLAIRCARDSMPPLRLAILDDLAEHPDSSTHGRAQAARQAADDRRPAAAGAAHARRAHVRRGGVRDAAASAGTTHWPTTSTRTSSTPKSCPEKLVSYLCISSEETRQGERTEREGGYGEGPTNFSGQLSEPDGDSQNPTPTTEGSLRERLERGAGLKIGQTNQDAAIESDRTNA